MTENGQVVAPIVTISEVAPSVESLQETPPDTGNFNNSTLRIDHKFQGRESILSSEISLYIEKTGQKIPDGGWGWLVVLACFVINMLSDGVGFTFGLLYKEFLIEFGASKSATSWIGSLFMALPLIAGPLGSALVDRYGCMTMTIAGGIVCTLGLALSSYAQTIGVMYLTFGVIGGLGLTLCFVTAVVSIAFWFEKRRTIALGLAASGTGFGTAIYSPLATWLLSEYGWRGTLLITAGFFANMCVCGALMRDPDWIIEEEKEEKRLKKARVRKSSISSIDTECLEEIKQTLEEGGDTQYLLQDVDATLDLTDKDRFNSVVDLPTFVRENEKVPLEVLKQLSENKQIYNIIVQNYPHLLAGRSSSEQGINFLKAHNHHASRVPVKFSLNIKKPDEVTPNNQDEVPPKNQDEVPPKNKDEVLAKNKDEVPAKNKDEVPPKNQDLREEHTNIDTVREVENKGTITPQLKGIHIFKSLSVKAKTQIQPQSYLRNVRFRKNSIGYRGAMLNIHKYKVKASSCPDIYKNSMATLFSEEESWYDEFIDILKDLTNFSLFLDLHFLLLALSTVMVDMWFVVPYYYLADHMAIHHYTDNEAAFAISIIGITNTIGMVLLGIVGNRINTAKTYAICLILCGASIGIMIVVTSNYILILVSGGFFGLFFASTMSLTPSLLAELVSLDDFTMAYGLLLLSQGVGTLVGPPVAGWVFDLTGSWDQSFYQASMWIIISGLLVGVIPFTRNRKLFTTT